MVKGESARRDEHSDMEEEVKGESARRDEHSDMEEEDGKGL